MLSLSRSRQLKRPMASISRASARRSGPTASNKRRSNASTVGLVCPLSASDDPAGFHAALLGCYLPSLAVETLFAAKLVLRDSA